MPKAIVHARLDVLLAFVPSRVRVKSARQREHAHAPRIPAERRHLAQRAIQGTAAGAQAMRCGCGGGGLRTCTGTRPSRSAPGAPTAGSQPPTRRAPPTAPPNDCSPYSLQGARWETVEGACTCPRGRGNPGRRARRHEAGRPVPRDAPTPQQRPPWPARVDAPPGTFACGGTAPSMAELNCLHSSLRRYGGSRGVGAPAPAGALQKALGGAPPPAQTKRCP